MWSNFIGWRLVLRQLTASPAVAATTFATVLITGVFIIGAPLFFEDLSQRALVDVVSNADPAVKNIAVSRTTTIPVLSGETPFQRVEKFGTDLADSEFGPSTAALVEKTEYLVESPRFMILSGPDGPLPSPAFLRLRHQSSVTEKVRLIGGHMPVDRDPALALSGPECDAYFLSEGERPDPPELRRPQPAVDCEVVEIPLFEAVFSQGTLQETGLKVGDRVSIAPDTTDFAAFGDVPGNMLDYQVFVEVSGVISLADTTDGYWYGDLALGRPRLVKTPDFEIVYATGLASPAAYREMLGSFRPANWRYAWRYFVDERLLDPDEMPAVQAEVRALQGGFPPASPFDPGRPSVSTGLPELIDVFFEQRWLAYSTLAMSGAGLLITSTAVVLMMAALASVRDGTSLILLRSRGGTAGQLLSARAAQGLLLVVPAVAFSYVTAHIASTGESPLADVGVVALASTAMGAFVVAVLPFTRPSLSELLSRGSRSSKGSLRRVVGETFIVVGAAGASLLLRRRLQSGPSTPDEPFDVMLAAAPVLVGAAVGVITIRLVGISVQALALVASRRRGPVLFVGLRRVLQLPTVARLPLIAVVAAVGLSVFSSIVQVSIIDGQVESTFHSVGADYSVTVRNPGEQLSGDYGLSSLESVTAVARAARLPDMSMRSPGEQTDSTDGIEVIALEFANYQSVTNGTEADQGLPVEIFTEYSPSDSPIPVLVSDSWPGRANPGSRFTLNGIGVSQSFQVAGVLEQFPGTGVTPFTIVDLATLETAMGRQLAITDLYLDAPPDAASSIQSAVNSRFSNAVVRSQHDELDRARSSPFVSGTILALTVAAAMAGLLGIVAAVGSMALTGPDRRRDLGHLRTLGLSPRQALGMTALEQIPSITIAAIVGSVLGIALVVIFEPGLNLTALTGPSVTDAVKLQPLRIGLTTAALVGAMVIAVIVFASGLRRKNLGQLLRMGNE